MEESGAVTLGPRIAYGRQAEIYGWQGTDAVVKLYRAGFPGYAAEVAALAALDGTGIAPRLLDQVSVNGRDGLVMERLDGTDMLTLLQRNAVRLPALARGLARAALDIHQVTAPAGLPDMVDVVRDQIQAADLDTRRREFALRTLGTLPAGDRLCHGDFHPGNAVVIASGTRIIDWPLATRGVPAADFARTMLLLRHADPPTETPLALRMLLAAGRSMFARAFARAYHRGTRQPLADVATWTVVHAAARLAEDIAAERPRLIETIDVGAASVDQA